MSGEPVVIEPKLYWHLVDRENRKAGKMWRTQVELWARLEVWLTESNEWAWKVGLGGTQGMAFVGISASPDEAKLAAENYLRGLVFVAVRQLGSAP